MSPRKKLTGLLALIALFPILSADAAVVASPQKNQSASQQEKDKTSCAQMASKETGVDPNALQAEAPPESSGKQSSAPRGAAKGAAAGAAVGAIAGDAGKGAAIGAGAGGAGGAVKKRKQKNAAEEQGAQAQADQQKKLETYEQAEKTCLEGKGYTVSISAPSSG